MSDTAATIRAARAYANLTQQQLAAALGVDVQTIKRRESSRGTPAKRGELLAIALACGVPIEFLERGFPAVTAPGAVDELAALRETVDALRDEVADLSRSTRPGEDAARAAEAAGRRRQQRRSARDEQASPRRAEGREG